MAFFVQNHLARAVCIFFRHCSEGTCCINWSLFSMQMSKGTVAYVEGNSHRDVASIHVWSNAALFPKAFALCCFYPLSIIHVCRTLRELLRVFCYRSSNVWFWKEQHPYPFFCNAGDHLSIGVWWTKLVKQRTPTACHSPDLGCSKVADNIFMRLTDESTLSIQGWFF